MADKKLSWWLSAPLIGILAFLMWAGLAYFGWIIAEAIRHAS